jgi:hypothetical protein
MMMNCPRFITRQWQELILVTLLLATPHIWGFSAVRPLSSFCQKQLETSQRVRRRRISSSFQIFASSSSSLSSSTSVDHFAEPAFPPVSNQTLVLEPPTITTTTTIDDDDEIRTILVTDATDAQVDGDNQEEDSSSFVVPSVGTILKFAIPAIGIWLCSPLLSMIDTSAVGLLAGTAQQAVCL